MMRLLKWVAGVVATPPMLVAIGGALVLCGVCASDLPYTVSIPMIVLGALVTIGGMLGECRG